MIHIACVTLYKKHTAAWCAETDNLEGPVFIVALVVLFRRASGHCVWPTRFSAQRSTPRQMQG